MPYLNILSEFRNNIRTYAKELKAELILKKCDELRDDILPNVGVRLEDREGKSNKFVFFFTVPRDVRLLVFIQSLFSAIFCR